MLMLSRKKGETVHIGDDIVIKVVDTNSRLVRLGINAPDVAVKRGEVYKRVQEEKKAAAVEADGNTAPVKAAAVKTTVKKARKPA